MNTEFERVAIISHAQHRLYIEDIPLDILNKEYNGEEEAYIKDNYNELGEFTWDYINDAVYISSDEPDPITIDFGELEFDI